MIKNKTVLALIPARSGSKRLKNKNMKLLNGRSLIDISIDAAIYCPNVDKIVISTDYPISFTSVDTIHRPPELAQDDTQMYEVAVHALKYYEYDIIVLLQPTSPLRFASDIRVALELLSATKAVFSSNDMKTPNGSVYAIYANKLKRTKSFETDAIPFYVKNSIDIDTIEDFNDAKELLNV